MPTSSQSSPAKSKLSALLDLLLDISSALGTLREHQRLTEDRQARHAARLAAAEGSITSLQATIATWKASSPNRTCDSPTKATRIAASATATSPAMDTPQSSPIKRMARKLVMEWGKDGLIWIVGKLGGFLLPYVLATSGLLLVYGQAALKWLAMLWKALIG